MTVFLVMQSDKLRFGKPSGPSRVRGVFSTKEGAEENIGPQDEKYIKCKECGHSHKNQNVELDMYGEPWRKKLFIKEWKVQ